MQLDIQEKWDGKVAGWLEKGVRGEVPGVKYQSEGNLKSSAPQLPDPL